MKSLINFSSLLALALAASAQARPSDYLSLNSIDSCPPPVAHTPEAEITYRPGITTHGESVAPADIPGTSYDAYEYSLELNAAPEEFMPSGTAGRLPQASELLIGTVTGSEQEGSDPAITLFGTPLPPSETEGCPK